MGNWWEPDAVQRPLTQDESEHIRQERIEDEIADLRSLSKLIAASWTSEKSTVDLVPVTRNLAEYAAVIAAEHRIRGNDAVYVAVAAQLDDALVTLDRQQLKRAASIIRVRKP